MDKAIAELAGKRDKETLALWACDCAEHVLLYFEENLPQDDRPRKAVEAGRAWIRGEIKVSAARAAAFAAHLAAREADYTEARAAARAAAHAAATAHVREHAVHAAAYAAKAAYAAAERAAASTAAAREREWQLKRLSGMESKNAQAQ